MNYKEKPIFVIASERSGTNLLRLRINENQAYYLGPSPVHFLKNLYFQQPYYGDLSVDRNFLLFISDALRLCHLHFSPWCIEWTSENVLKGFGDKNRNAISLMHYMMNRYAEEQGFKGYICKDNYLYEFAIDIASEIPEARFIYLYRDPRDFVLSQIKRPEGIKSIARYSRLWSYEQVRAIAVGERLRFMGRCLFISYEDLISDEKNVIDKILQFMRVEREKGSRYKDNIQENIQEWSNISKDTNSDNSGKYLKELSVRKISMIENICARQMTYLGYENACGVQGNISSIAIYADILLGEIRKKVQMSLHQPDKSSAVYKRGKFLAKIRVNYRSDIFY